MSRNWVWGYLALGLAMSLWTANALGQDNLTRVSNKQMETWLKSARKVEWSRSGKGRYQLKLDGHIVVLTNKQVDCWLHAEFDTGGKGDLKAINAWNNRSRGTRAYLDEDNDPCLEMDIDFEGGMNEFAFYGLMDWFRLQLNRFADEVVP